ncbi:MAG: NAD(P)/FAD-dependent oxidoreductase [Minwuia sp.]|uniref:NAD(P)/FAD-dependent oxidoreductase n=1 Tax=Minwuia sp. TaxID=2493630 RepID=UPI003A8BA3C5
MTELADVVVIGAGVVGLAVARRFALAGRDVIVIEREGHIGEGTSSRNSEVIHAGIYYPKGSLKARSCVAGKWMLYDFCQSHGVAHRNCGKLIVASSVGQLPELEALNGRAAANGVDDMRFLDRAATLAMEPALRAEGALLSPSTGIVDSHAFMLALQGAAEDHGAMIAFNTRVAAIHAETAGPVIETAGEAPMRLKCRTLINAAGLSAPLLADRAGGGPRPRHYAKGNYYTLAGRSPFSRLIYPVPEPGGLGVHLTIDMAGEARFGPDVEWLDGTDPDTLPYAVDPGRADGFYAAIRSYWPGLPDGALQPGYSGIRPKLSGPDEPAADFVIEGPGEHGLPGLVNMLGIESPGLTASLALADMVYEAGGS